jgi:hypothetical protein
MICHRRAGEGRVKWRFAALLATVVTTGGLRRGSAYPIASLTANDATRNVERPCE